MNIVIIGAGDVGRHISQILSKQEHNIILIDTNPKKLEIAQAKIDVATRKGSGTDWLLLDELLELAPEVFIAVTGHDETNLSACAIAKHLGYPRTICRVRGNRFLNRTRLDFAHIFDVDSFIGPELLVAHEILKFMLSPASLAIENFIHGSAQMRTLEVPPSWDKEHLTLKELELPPGVMVGLIRRGANNPNTTQQTLFPHGNDAIRPGDEVTFIGESEVTSRLQHYLNVPQIPIQSAVIVGGSLTGLTLAKLLERQRIDVRLIEKDYDKCCELAEELTRTSILNHDATDQEFLRAEKIGNADIFVSCTRSDETNLLTALLGKEVGCKKTLMLLTNTTYAPLIKSLGIDYTVSPRISAANHILSQVVSGTVSSLVSLYENQAEILEINVSKDSKLVGIPISELGPLLPKDFLISVIQNRGRIMVAHGNRIISPGDTIIVITSPDHVAELEKVF